MSTLPSLAVSSTLDDRSNQALRAALIATSLALNGVIVLSVTVSALWAGRHPDLYFAEGSIVTVWSALQMIAICAMCLWIFQLRRDEARFNHKTRAHWLWLVVALGAGVLSLDEAASIHETIDHQIHALLAVQENPWTDRIDDAIVLGYGGLALALAYFGRAELVILRSTKDVLILAFVLFFIMVAIDLLTNSYSITPRNEIQSAQFDRLRAWGVVIEDSFKLASEGVFIAAFATVALTCKRNANAHDST